jgi:hypothetical protein
VTASRSPAAASARRTRGRQNDLTKRTSASGNRLPPATAASPLPMLSSPQPWGFLFNPTGPLLNRCLARFIPVLTPPETRDAFRHVHRDALRDALSYDPATRDWLIAGASLPASLYQAATAYRDMFARSMTALLRRMMSSSPLLLMVRLRALKTRPSRSMAFDNLLAPISDCIPNRSVFWGCRR